MRFPWPQALAWSRHSCILATLAHSASKTMALVGIAQLPPTGATLGPQGTSSSHSPCARLCGIRRVRVYAKRQARSRRHSAGTLEPIVRTRETLVQELGMPYQELCQPTP